MRDNWEWGGGEGTALGEADIEGWGREKEREGALRRLINHHH